MREELPRQESTKCEYRIRNSVRAYADEPSKEQTKDQHHQEWLDDGPQRSECSLLVSDFDVAPGEEIEELAILPQLTQTK